MRTMPPSNLVVDLWEVSCLFFSLCWGEMRSRRIFYFLYNFFFFGFPQKLVRVPQRNLVSQPEE